MRLYLRLYKRYDRDLLSLYYNPYVRFGRVVKEALQGYLSGSGERVPPLPHYTVTRELQTEFVNVYLHEGEDDAIIDWLQGLEPNCRSAAVKCVLRSRLEEPCLDLYLMSGAEDGDEPPQMASPAKPRPAERQKPVSKPKPPPKRELVPPPEPSPGKPPEPPNAAPENGAGDFFQATMSMLQNFKGVD